MPITARSAPNNGRVKEAKVSSCTRGTGKALNGKAKRDVNRRANNDERRDIREDIRQAKREDENKNIKGEIRKGRREDKSGNVRQAIIGNRNENVKGKVRRGRGENNFRLWEITGSYKAVEWEVQPDQQPHLHP